MLRTMASLFVSASLLGACTTDSAPGGSGKDETAQIASRVDLDTYLQTASPSPLDALAPRARQRFVEGLVFSSDGLEQFDYAELVPLTRDQVYDILSLFGMEYATQTVVADAGIDLPGEAKPPKLFP